MVFSIEIYIPFLKRSPSKDFSSMYFFKYQFSRMSRRHKNNGISLIVKMQQPISYIA